MADHSDFSATATVRLAWEKVKGAKGAFWLTILVLIFFQLVNGGINSYLASAPKAPYHTLYSLISLIASIVATFLTWGLIYLGIQRARDNAIQFSMVGYVFDIWIFLKMIGVAILQFFIFLPVFLLFFLPMLILAKAGSGTGIIILNTFIYLFAVILFIFLILRMYLVSCFVIAEKMNPIRAIKMSFRATRGHIWQLIGLFIINWFILLLSILLLGIGLIWSIPYLFINFGVVYRKLSENISLQ